MQNVETSKVNGSVTESATGLATESKPGVLDIDATFTCTTVELNIFGPFISMESLPLPERLPRTLPSIFHEVGIE